MEYEINNNWLLKDGEKIKSIPCYENKTSSGKNVCDYIVYHYTASTTAESAHRTFQTNGTQVSWHLTIDRKGNLFQLYDFRSITWHAGKSEWRKPSGTPISNLNKYAIGIEMINAGPLDIKHGKYYTWFNQEIHKDDVFFDQNGRPWQAFTHEQIQTAMDITPVLIDTYRCVDVLGHEEISPGRKKDPGPAFFETLKKLKEMC